MPITLLARRQADERALGWQERLAEHITTFAGSMPFPVAACRPLWRMDHPLWRWIILNLGVLPGMPPFDPTFVVLAMVASVEAIFLSTFILITQNRMQAQADRRADANLQISLLAEHEITRLISMVAEIGERMQVPAAQHPELDEIKRDVHPEQVLETIKKREERWLSALRTLTSPE